MFATVVYTDVPLLLFWATWLLAAIAVFRCFSASPRWIPLAASLAVGFSFLLSRATFAGQACWEDGYVGPLRRLFRGELPTIDDLPGAIAFWVIPLLIMEVARQVIRRRHPGTRWTLQRLMWFVTLIALACALLTALPHWLGEAE